MLKRPIMFVWDLIFLSSKPIISSPLRFHFACNYL